MRDSIRLPCDVTIATKLTEENPFADVDGELDFQVDAVPNGKFKKIRSIKIMVGSRQLLLVVPKERNFVRSESASNDNKETVREAP